MSAEDADAGWEPFFWATFERSANAMALADEARRFVAANPAMLTVLDRRRNELIGRRLPDFVAPGARVRTESEWHAFLQTGEGTGTQQFVRGDGNVVSINFAGQVERVTGRRLVLFVMLDAAGETYSTRRTDAPPGELTPREREVVHQLTLGRSSREVADELFVSEPTVRTHVRNAMAKLQARTRAQLVAIALSQGIVRP
jgi:PAS domain S-box-containing protein